MAIYYGDTLVAADIVDCDNIFNGINVFSQLSAAEGDIGAGDGLDGARFFALVDGQLRQVPYKLMADEIYLEVRQRLSKEGYIQGEPGERVGDYNMNF